MRNMNANEIVNVLRACGNGNSVCEKCPFYIREDSNECRFNAIYESADIIQAQQQEINLLIMEITELRESNQALKDYAENADADKDEQAGTIMRLVEALEEATEDIENLYGHDTPQTERYRALLGGTEG